MKSAFNGGVEEFQSPDQKVGSYVISKFEITFGFLLSPKMASKS
jgi:hypothetical protein